MAKTPPLLVSFHTLSQSPMDTAKFNRGEYRITPHYFTERDYPWVKLYFEEFLRFQGKTRRDAIQHFEGCLPFDSPGLKRKFLYSVLERLSLEEDAKQEGRKARKVRAAVFLEAAKCSVKEVTTTIAQAVADQLDEPNLLDLLFSDLPLEKKLTSLSSTMSTQQLVLRANLCIAQRLLYKSASVHIRAHGNIRKIIRQAKLRRLICQVSSIESEEVSSIEISGPLSLFGHTTLYGRSLAELVPLLFWCNRFTLLARCKIKGRVGILELNNSDPILPATEPKTFDSKVEARFSQDFLKAFPDWNLIREPNPFVIPGESQTMIFPDFKIQHRRIPDLYWYLEIIGYWTPHYLQQKIERLRLANIKNLILCVDKALICEELDPLLESRLSTNLIFFKQRILMEQIEEILYHASKQ